MRIVKTKFYLLATTPGISGFQQWGKLDLRIVTGHKAATRKIDVVAEFNPIAVDLSSIFYNRMLAYEDGHIRGHQPLINSNNIQKVLLQMPYDSVFVATIDKAELGKFKGDPALKFF